MSNVLVVTGLSGGGRSEFAKDLDDLGWYVMDR
ncbi:MAG: RNase adaptor protein RapZ, partial [Actinobacteria bacterium]|nr:RNase adaptor protein RapZ [Actinomycetota bacterium]MBT5505189.1 RNase adaptor protein RapZ [Actinomycetota bacterium]MBT7379795.1 RNase adaptor protein RapZ [Actinomycetota bacterium]MBT7585520.1 RNase adaptor protein RapZ [Gemmatimonadota bacterium]